MTRFPFHAIVGGFSVPKLAMTTPGAGATPITSPAPKKYYSSLWPGKGFVVPDDFAMSVQAIERELNVPVWLLIQKRDGKGDFDALGESVKAAFFSARADLVEGEPIAIVVDSSGGSAESAYQLARFLRQQCSGFTTIIPEYAKSAATLFVLGADRIILARDAELGPLDVQVDDPDREQRISALDEVQALERLNAFALQAVDSCMLLLRRRSGKTIATLLPGVQHFVADMLRPLFEKIDTVHYTQMSRWLKVAEEYAVRLLQPKYPYEEAIKIARHLVHGYPEHEFFIDGDEAAAFGLDNERPSKNLDVPVRSLLKHLDQMTIIGRLKEVTP